MGLPRTFVQDIILFELNNEGHDPRIVSESPPINYNYRPCVSIATRDTNNNLHLYLNLIRPFVVREQFVGCLDTDCKNEFKVTQNLFLEYMDSCIPSLVQMFTSDPYAIISISHPLLVPIAAITINNDQYRYHRVCEIEYELYDMIDDVEIVKTYLEPTAYICESPLSELFVSMLFYAKFVTAKPILKVRTK